MLSPTPCIFWVPFYVKNRENSQKKQKCFYLPVAMWSLTSPMAAIQMPLLLGDTWWSSGRPLGGRLPAQSRLIANQLQWTFPNLPQRPPSYNPPCRLAAVVSSLSGSRFRVGLYHKIQASSGVHLTYRKTCVCVFLPDDGVCPTLSCLSKSLSLSCNRH